MIPPPVLSVLHIILPPPLLLFLSIYLGWGGHDYCTMMLFKQIIENPPRGDTEAVYQLTACPGQPH